MVKLDSGDAGSIPLKVKPLNTANTAGYEDLSRSYQEQDETGNPIVVQSSVKTLNERAGVKLSSSKTLNDRAVSNLSSAKTLNERSGSTVKEFSDKDRRASINSGVAGSKGWAPPG